MVPDLSKAELVDFTIESGDTKARLKLADGSVLEVKVEITGVLHLGNDPNTGFPIYNFQFAPTVRLVSVPKELRKAPVRPGAKDSKNVPGFS